MKNLIALTLALGFTGAAAMAQSSAPMPSSPAPVPASTVQTAPVEEATQSATEQKQLAPVEPSISKEIQEKEQK